MTKLDGRTKAAFDAQLEESLNRLLVDHLDLVQFHENIRPDDADRIFAPGGAFEAALAAKQAGKVRFIGFTGHKIARLPPAHDRAGDASTASPSTRCRCRSTSSTRTTTASPPSVIPVAQQLDMGILAMKTFGDHNLLEAGVVDPIDMLHYGMNLPTSVVITGIDKPEVLDQADHRRDDVLSRSPQAQGRRRSSPRAPTWRATASTSATRPRTTSTAPSRTRAGWAERGLDFPALGVVLARPALGVGRGRQRRDGAPAQRRRRPPAADELLGVRAASPTPRWPARTTSRTTSAAACGGGRGAKRGRSGPPPNSARACCGRMHASAAAVTTGSASRKLWVCCSAGAILRRGVV